MIHIIDDKDFDSAKKTISSLITSNYYNYRLNVLKNSIFGPIKVPNYETWLENISLEVVDINNRLPSSYYRLPLILLEHNNIFIPILFVRDEEIHDEHKVIPTVSFDQYCHHNYWLWVAGLQNTDILSKMGLVIIPNGMSNPLVDVTRVDNLSRYRRYYKNLQVNILYDLSGIERKLQHYTPLALQYWQSQNIYAEICDNLDMYLGCADSRLLELIAIEVIQDSGESGIGIFTIFEEDELYWDYSRRSIGNHIGNNILYAACLYAQERNLTYLNLGVGFYKWKNNWSKGLVKYIPGVKCIEGSELAIMRDKLITLTGKPLTEGYNKERLVT